MLSPHERRERNRTEMQRAILDAARAIMREQGVAALSLREVARRVKLQAPSLYAYFPSKMALYDTVFIEGYRLINGYWLAATRESASARESLQGWLEVYMRFALDHPELYQLCFERPVPGFVPSEANMQEIGTMMGAFDRQLGALLAAGQLTPSVPARQARDLLIAMMHGLTSQHLANEPHLPLGEGRYGALIPAAVELFLAAWASDERAGLEQATPALADRDGATN
jgi:AcrR family transcriptional regulator